MILRRMGWMMVIAGLVLGGVGGVFAGEVVLTPTLSVKETYNDNIFLIDEDRLRDVAQDAVLKQAQETGTDPQEPQPAEPQLSDYVTAVSPGLDLKYDTDRLTSLITLRADVLWYADLTDLNDVNQFYKGIFDYDISDYSRVSVEAGYARDSDPARDLQTSGLILGTTIRKRQRYLFTASHDLSDVSGVNLSYRYEQDDFSNSDLDDQLIQLALAEEAQRAREAAEAGVVVDAAGAETSVADLIRRRRGLVDSKAHTVSLGYQRDLGGWLAESFAFSDVSFLHYDTDETTQDNLTMVLGAGYQISDAFSVQGDAGARYSHENFDDVQQKLLPEAPFFEPVDVQRSQDQWGPVGHLSIDYRGELSHASLKFSYDVQPASGRGTLTNRTEFRFDVWRRFLEDFSARAYATYFFNKRDSVVALPPVADEEALKVHNEIPALKERLDEVVESLGIDEKTLTLGAALTYDINRYFSVVGSYAYTVLKREITDSDARRNLVFLRIDFRYPDFLVKGF